MSRVFSIAASLLVVAALFGWLATQNHGLSGSAIAQMVEQVRSARTVVFTSLVEMRGRPEREQGKTMVLWPDSIREEMGEGGNRHVLIFNTRERKSLSLSPDTKKATLRDLAGDPSTQPMNILDQIRQVRETSAEFQGREEIEGKETLKYRCKNPLGHFLLWLTPEEQLPVKVVWSEAGGNDEQFVTITLTDFQWNAPLDESLFTLDVPNGYELERDKSPGPGLDPTDFITTLRAFVRLNNNQFPDEYNALTTGSMIQFLDDPSLPPEERKANYRRKLAHALERVDLEDANADAWQDAGREIGKTFARGSVFLQILLQSHDWHYVGKGVRLGEADKVVAWWSPKAKDQADGSATGQPTATVLYGDFHLATKPIAGLPTEAD